MHIMNMFCPIIKSSKSRKTHPPSTRNNNCVSEVIGKGTGGNGGGQNNISNTSINNTNNNNNNNNLNNNNNNNNNNNSHINNNNTNSNSNSNSVHRNNINSVNHIENQLIATSNPCRFVIDHYTPIELDELNVSPGDMVFLISTDVETTTGIEWSYVVSLESLLKGYVPSSILSIEPPKRNHVVEPKKKLPRSIINHHNITPNQHHLHNPHNHHNFSYRTQHHTLQNHLQTNLIEAQNHHNIPHELKYTLFSRENFGLFMVTNNFIAREENDLSVRPGDYTFVLNKDDDDWYWVRRYDDSKEGFVPSKFICDFEQVKAFINKGNSTVTMKSSNNNDFHTYMNQTDHKMQAMDSPTTYH